MSRPAWHVSADPLGLQESKNDTIELDLSEATAESGSPTDAVVDDAAKMALAYRSKSADDDLSQRFIDTTEIAIHDRAQIDRIVALRLDGVRLSASVRTRLQQLSPLRLLDLPSQKITALQLLELYRVLGRECHVVIADDSALVQAGKLTVPEGMLQHRQVSDFLMFLNRVRVATAETDQPLLQRINALSFRGSQASIDGFMHGGIGLIPPNVSTLDLSNNPASQMAKGVLTQLSDVKNLNLSGCGIEFSSTAELIGLPRIEVVNVVGNVFTRTSFARLAARLPSGGIDNASNLEFKLEDDAAEGMERLAKFAMKHRTTLLPALVTGVGEEKAAETAADDPILVDRLSDTMHAASDYLLLLPGIKHQKVENKAKSFRLFGSKDYRDLPEHGFAVVPDEAVDELRDLFNQELAWAGDAGIEHAESLIAAQAVAGSSVFAAGSGDAANVFKRPVEFACIKQLIAGLEAELPKMRVSHNHYRARYIKDASTKNQAKFAYINQLCTGAKMVLAACYSLRASARVITDKTEVSLGEREFAAMTNYDAVIEALGKAPQLGAAEHKAVEAVGGMVHSGDDAIDDTEHPYAPLLG